MKIANKSFNDRTNFKHLEITLTNQIYMHEEINSRLVPPIIQSRISILPICHLRTWSLTVREGYSILKLSTTCILAANHFFLFQLNAHNMLNTYIYHQLPSKCLCLLHHLQGDHCITCSKTMCFWQCCYKMYNVPSI
jgi:hypothetical protein